MDYLIIGAGPAVVNAAETLRDRDPEAGVRMVGEEPEARAGTSQWPSGTQPQI